MAKWARRARLQGTKTGQAFEPELPRIKEEAAHSAEDLRFAFQTEGMGLVVTPPYTEEGLLEVEAHYRKHHAKLRDRELVERLLALFLGQIVVLQHQGEWVIYTGRHHVYFPIVVELGGSGRFIEPFLYCSDLAGPSNLIGAKQGRALTTFLRNRETHAHP